MTEYWRGDIPWVSGKDLKQPALDDTGSITFHAYQKAWRMEVKWLRLVRCYELLIVRGMGLAKDLPVAGKSLWFASFHGFRPRRKRLDLQR